MFLAFPLYICYYMNNHFDQIIKFIKQINTNYILNIWKKNMSEYLKGWLTVGIYI
jgi:hypothetical protein